MLIKPNKERAFFRTRTAGALLSKNKTNYERNEGL